jgi:hypothetical protein
MRVCNFMESNNRCAAFLGLSLVFVFAFANTARADNQDDKWQEVTISAKSPQFKKFYEALNRLYPNPNAKDYEEAIRLLATSGQYRPWSKDRDQIDNFVDNGAIDAAYHLYDNSMPNLALSPGAHIMAWGIARSAGNKTAESYYWHMATGITKSILQTGDGTRAHPWLVSRTSDEYDLLKLEFGMKTVATWELVTEKDGRHLDHLRTTDGHDYWFNWTYLYKYGQKEPAEEAARREAAYAGGKPVSVIVHD